MVLSDVNGNGKKSSAAERWLRQRNGQRASAARCIFGPPEKRAHLMIIMRNEAEMERKRIEFVSRYEPVGLSSSERRSFYDGLIRTSSPTPRNNYHHHNNVDNMKNVKVDHYQSHSHHHHSHQNHQKQQFQQQKNSSFNQSDEDRKN